MSEDMRVRAGVVRIVDHGETTTVIGAREARSFTGDSAAFLRAVLEIHARPVTRTELIAELDARAGMSTPTAIVDELLAILVEDGVLIAAQPVRVARPLTRRRVVLGITGAVAAVDAPALVRGLQASGCEVRIALSRTARRFVSVAALEALTHHAVWQGIWQRDAHVPVPHVNLGEWADLVLVCPASATSLARIATGDCSDLVAAIVAATRAPVVLVPSMNDAMYESPAVQANLATLRDHGRWLVHPAMGFEVAHRPQDRRSLFGAAPPATAVLDIVRHVLDQTAPRPQLPADGAAWEQVWATRTPDYGDGVDAPLGAALDARRGDGQGRRLIDLGTGAGRVAIEAARRGYAVTALDISPSALRQARQRAGELPIQLVLDDITRPSVEGHFDIAVDCGLFHCLPREQWTAYATAVSRLVAPGGALLLVAHRPGVELATNPVTDAEVRTLLPGFQITNAVATTLAGGDATLYELEHRG